MSGIEFRRPIPPRLLPVAARLAAAGASTPCLEATLGLVGGRVEGLRAKSQLQRENESLRHPRYLLAGWACRFTELPDGRRQIFDVILPGEGIGVCVQPRPLALTSVMALTPVELIDASDLIRSDVLDAHPELLRALTQIADDDERRMLAHVTRLGRMSALEALSHLLVQLHDRLAEIGAVEQGRFALPLTQKQLGDLLGLSAIHLNRTMQHLRRAALVKGDRVYFELLDRAALLRLLL